MGRRKVTLVFPILNGMDGKSLLLAFGFLGKICPAHQKEYLIFNSKTCSKKSLGSPSHSKRQGWRKFPCRLLFSDRCHPWLSEYLNSGSIFLYIAPVLLTVFSPAHSILGSRDVGWECANRATHSSNCTSGWNQPTFTLCMASLRSQHFNPAPFNMNSGVRLRVYALQKQI